MSINAHEERATDLERTLPTETEIEKEACTHTNFIGGIFRVAKTERPMFFRMSGMFLIIAFIYSIMRNAKDAFVLSSQEQNSMSYLKNAIIVVSIAAVILIQYLMTRYKISYVLMGMVFVYVIYFFAFGLVLYPFHHYFELSQYFCADKFGCGMLAFRGFSVFYSLILIFNFWVTSVFYILSELWGNLILSLLFLSFSNDVLTFKQSLRFIPLFYVASNIGLFMSGVTMMFVGKITENAPYAINQWAIPVTFVMLGILGILCIFIHYNLETTILTKKLFIIESTKVKKEKKKIGIIEGLSHCFKSKLLLNFCLIVLSYNITVNIIDSLFKIIMKIKAINDNRPTDSFTMISEAVNQIITAILVIIFLLTPLSQLVQKSGWFLCGMISPLLSALTSLLAILLAIYNTSHSGKQSINIFNKWAENMGQTEKWSKFFINAEFCMSRASSILFKVTKYAFFDVAKESLSMRISNDKRATYKAVYDGVTGKLGKAANGGISFILLSLVNSDNSREISFFLLFISGLFFYIWIHGVFYLARKYDESLAANTDIDPDYFIKTVDKEGLMDN